MEPIIHFTDYPSLYPEIITRETVKKEWEELYTKRIRKKLGGNKGIHKPNDI